MTLRSAMLPLFTVVILGVVDIPAGAQSSTLGAQAEADFVASLAAWGAGDVEVIASSGGSAAGFGFRSIAARGAEAPEAGWNPELLKSFFDSLEYYELSSDEIHTAVHGDVVVAWGFFTESFRHRGGEPEVVRVRFSSTMMRGDDGRLRTILAHRDIQPFGADGRYIRQSE